MKKTKINKQLSLNKKTIAHLRGNELEAANGGATGTCGSVCIPCIETQGCTRYTCPYYYTCDGHTCLDC